MDFISDRNRRVQARYKYGGGVGYFFKQKSWMFNWYSSETKSLLLYITENQSFLVYKTHITPPGLPMRRGEKENGRTCPHNIVQ